MLFRRRAVRGQLSLFLRANIDLTGAFMRDRRGGVALIFGLFGTLLIALVGGAVDYTRLVNQRSRLQTAVDAGVLAGGNALKLASSTADTVKGVTEQTIRDAAKSPADQQLSIRTNVDLKQGSVFAYGEETLQLSFGGFFGFKTRQISAQARVNVVGKMRLCMLTLDPGAPGAFNLQASSRVTAENCSLYADSKDQRAMVGGASAMARAQSICSAGGYDGERANFSPTPQTSCPVIADPLKDRPAPSMGPCKTPPPNTDIFSYFDAHHYHVDHHHHGSPAAILNVNVGAGGNSNGRGSQRYTINTIAQSTTLEPGTYCGGIYITGNAVVRLKPGTYIIKDGPLLVDMRASLIGENVGIYFSGERAGLLFNTDTTISLTAPTNGEMAGILLSEDRSVRNPIDPAEYLNQLLTNLLGLPACPLRALLVTLTPRPLGQTSPMRIYRVISNNTRQMLGTIYLPAGRLVLDGARPVADQSAYTVIVASQINLYKGPNLVLNADYDRSNVPVPKGVGPLPGQIQLTK